MFRTTFDIAPVAQKIQLNSTILSLGSCFADVMGHRLSIYKIDTLTNPFGIIYNPVSIARLLHNAINKKPLSSTGFIERDGIWYHHDLHSDLHAPSKIKLAELYRIKSNETLQTLGRADWLIITLGTAVVYRHEASGEIVANCHKVPQRHFIREILDTEDVVKTFSTLNEVLLASFPGLKILLTVSPVRHIKDTIPVNNLGKAVLIVAANQIKEQFDHLTYFPAYELMMDDLRDYRFYKEDMIHPNSVAEDYIWDRLVTSYLDESARQFITEWSKIRKSLAHRPFHATSSDHQKFLKSLLNKLKKLQVVVNVEEEIKKVRAQMV